MQRCVFDDKMTHLMPPKMKKRHDELGIAKRDRYHLMLLAITR